MSVKCLPNEEYRSSQLLWSSTKYYEKKNNKAMENNLAFTFIYVINVEDPFLKIPLTFFRNFGIKLHPTKIFHPLTINLALICHPGKSPELI